MKSALNTSEPVAIDTSRTTAESAAANSDSAARSASWRSAMLVCEPAAVYDVEAEPGVRWPGESELETVDYSIRMPQPAGPVRCAGCRARFSAAGPTGFAEDRAICDMCLLEGSSELGMVLALVAVVRAFGIVQPTDREDYRDALRELGAFARIYERVAARSGPPRVFRVPSFES